MRRVASLCYVILAVRTVCNGTPIDNAIVAAMRLPEARNYQWIATVQDDSRFYTVEGKTQKDGYTLVSMPMVSSIQRQLGAGGSDIQTAIFRGDMGCVIDTPNGWKTPRELALSPSPLSQNPGGSGPPGPRRLPAPIGPGHPAFHYSNLQLNLSHPHDEVGIIVGSYSDVQPEPDGISGTLTEQGAKLLLVHPGQNEITALRANGTFQLWLKDGALLRYEVRLAGTIAVGVGPTRWEISLHQTVVTELKGLETTTFDVPEEAKRKLGYATALTAAATRPLAKE
jgi:hypothetical protein